MQNKLFRFVFLFIFPFAISCSNSKSTNNLPPEDKENLTIQPDHNNYGHQDLPPIPPVSPKEDPRCAGISYSTYTVLITNSWKNPKEREKSYSPNVLKIKVCDKVIWERMDNAVAMYHTATSTDTASANKFDTGAIPVNGKSRPIQFLNVGESSYFCTPHDWMRGKITVKPR